MKLHRARGRGVGRGACTIPRNSAAARLARSRAIGNAGWTRSNGCARVAAELGGGVPMPRADLTKTLQPLGLRVAKRRTG